MQVFINLDSQDLTTRGLFISKVHAAGHSGKVSSRGYELMELLAVAKAAGAEAILCTNLATLSKVASTGDKSNLASWRGSRINTSIPILVLQPTAHIFSLPYGEWLLKNDLAKLSHIRLPTFKYSYTICTDLLSINKAREVCAQAAIIVFDIETSRQNTITSVAFTCLGRQGQLEATFCIPLVGWVTNKEVADAYIAIKDILEHPGSQKAAHNGVFDCFHLLRHHIAVANYLWDTEYLWWSWHAELEKSLAFISSVLLPDYYYWKAEGEYDPLGYNCKDTINTARCLVQLLGNMPAWAFKNYAKTFPCIGPTIAVAFEGYKVDIDKLEAAKTLALAEVESSKHNLQVMTATPKFNPGSWQQLQTLFYSVLGAKKPARTDAGTDATSLKKISLQHPLIAKFVGEVHKYRENAKAYNTYYCADLLDGRVYYNIQIDGTETSRFSSSKSSLYSGNKSKTNKDRNYGLQIQNVPPYMRKALMADTGYKLGEVDKSQAEARCTAYLAQDALLIEDLETPGRDFYCYMAYRFFNLEIDKKHPLRQLVKKIVHGTNYMMQENTFIDSVGIEELQKYQQHIRGYERVGLQELAKHLLSLYTTIYAGVPLWWKRSAAQVAAKGLIETPDGWVREVFGNPLNDASILRSIVAHQAQRLSVGVLNQVWWKAYYKYQIPSKGAFRLKAQIHDSIKFQALIPQFDYFMEGMIAMMDIPIKFPTSELRIPTDAKSGYYWGDMK